MAVPVCYLVYILAIRSIVPILNMGKRLYSNGIKIRSCRYIGAGLLEAPALLSSGPFV